MQLDKKLYNEIKEYCKINNLNTRDFIHTLLKESFLKEKYGLSPYYKKKDNTPTVIETDTSIPIENEIKDTDIKIHDNILNNSGNNIKSKRKLN